MTITQLLRSHRQSGMSPAAHSWPLVQTMQRDPDLDQQVVREKPLREFKLRLGEGLQDRADRRFNLGVPVRSVLDQHVLQDAEHAGTDRTADMRPVVRSSLDRQEHDLDAHPHHPNALRGCYSQPDPAA